MFELIDLKITALETQKVLSMLSRNEAGIRRTPEQIISVILNTVIKDNNILNAIANLNGKVTEKTIKIPLSSLGEHWLSSLKKLIQLLK